MKRVILVLVVAVLFSCENKAPQKKEIKQEKLSVITVNYPLYYFANRIAGDLVNLKYIIPKNVDPAYWVPNENELVEYQSADIIIINGANYAKWMEDVSLPSSRIINTSLGYEEKLIYLKNLSTHSHGPEGEHEHAGYAFTTWLDFKLAIQQAEAIKNILVNKLPSEKENLEVNFESLKKDLTGLDSEMTTVATSLNDHNLMGSHPVYHYLAKGYNFEIHSLHLDSNELLSKKQLHDLKHLLHKSKTNLMLWENSPLQEIESKLSEFKVNIAVFSPCSNAPENGDYLSVMNSNLKNLKN